MLIIQRSMLFLVAGTKCVCSWTLTVSVLSVSKTSLVSKTECDVKKEEIIMDMHAIRIDMSWNALFITVSIIKALSSPSCGEFFQQKGGCWAEGCANICFGETWEGFS